MDSPVLLDRADGTSSARCSWRRGRRCDAQSSWPPSLLQGAVPGIGPGSVVLIVWGTQHGWELDRLPGSAPFDTAVDFGRERRYRRGLEERSQRDLHPEHLAEPGDQLRA